MPSSSTHPHTSNPIDFSSSCFVLGVPRAAGRDARNCLSCRLTNTPSTFERFLLASPNAVVDAFFARWPVDLIFRLRVLNTTLLCVVEAYRVRMWSPVPILMPFFADVRSFLLMLDKCGAVVSGSQVVRLLQRHPFPDTGSDLDVFLPRHGLLQMGRWLKKHGYRYEVSGHKHALFDVEAIRSASVAIGVNPDGTDAYPCNPQASHFATYQFTRQVVTSTASASLPRIYVVQLIVVEPGPIHYIINNFHSTGVMNWFTGKQIVSLFPRSTFIDRISYVSQDTLRSDWIIKYRKRGFEVVVAGGVPSKESVEIDTWERYVGDACTWIMPFDVPDCRLLLPSRIASRDRARDNHPSAIKFEVIPYGYGVTPPGAYLRVSAPFIYSALAFVMSGIDLPGTFYTSETARAFP